MKTFDDMYKDWVEISKTEISNEEYDEIMNEPVLIGDVIQEIVKVARFQRFAKKWVEDNKVELAQQPKKDE